MSTQDKQFRVADYFEDHEIEISNPDGTVSIADLSIFTKITPEQGKRRDTSFACIAADAIAQEYPWEIEDREHDYYNGAWIKFKDGSQLTIIDRN
jgi:hypothetical protein